MVSTIVEVKNNVGNRKVKVKIVSREKINDSMIRVIKEMTLDEVKKYCMIKGWAVQIMIGD